MLNEEKLRKAVQNAEEAFWQSIAEQYPEIKTGDLCYSAAMPFSVACEDVVRAWLRTNTPEFHHYNFDMIGAAQTKDEFTEEAQHPQLVMKLIAAKNDCKIVKAECFSIGDSWLFRLDGELRDMPLYVHKIGDDFKFADER